MLLHIRNIYIHISMCVIHTQRHIYGVYKVHKVEHKVNNMADKTKYEFVLI